MEPAITADTNVRVVEKVSSRVVTNKTIIQRTANTNAVQVNRYDAQGNLKSSEIDSKSWEDRDTQKYEWTDKDAQPAEVHSTAVDDRLEKFFSSPGEVDQTPTPGHGAVADQDSLVLASTERRDIPAVHWSGTHVDEQASKDEEHRTAMKLDGSQWSRSGESVWISSSAVASQSPSSPASNVTVLPLKGGVENGVDGVQSPVIQLTNGLSSPSPSPQPAAPAAAPALSVEERRKKRCMESQARRAATAAAS